MNTEIHKWLISIIDKGADSPFINDFVSFLAIFGKSYLISKDVVPEVRKKLYQDNSIYGETEDKRLLSLAIVCIAEIFDIDENGKYYQIVDFFEYEDFDVKNAAQEEIISKLRMLVCYTSHNFIYDNSDIDYKRIRNALNNCIRRNKAYKIKIENRKRYIFTCQPECINLSLPQIDSSKLTKMLFDHKLKKPSSCDLLAATFEILNNQDEYNNTVYYNIIVRSILEYLSIISGTSNQENVVYSEMDNRNTSELEQSVDFNDPFIFMEAFKSQLKDVIRINSIYKQIINESILYIYTSKKNEIDFSLGQYPVLRLLIDLNDKKEEKEAILKIINLVFHIINNQNLFNKALLYNNLENILLKYYLQKESV